MHTLGAAAASAPPSSATTSAASGGALPEIFRGFSFTGKLRPGVVSPRRTVPAGIERPDYAETGEPSSETEARRSLAIEVKTPEQIARMRPACRMAKEVLDAAGKLAKPGVTTEEIDKFVHEMIVSRGAYPSPLNYKGFPKSCCTSVNEIICHGIPDSRPLEDGDIVNIDITVFYKVLLYGSDSLCVPFDNAFGSLRDSMAM